MAETVRYNVVLNDEVSAKLAAIEARFTSLEAKIDGGNKAMGKMGKTMNSSLMLNAAGMAYQLGQQIWGMAEAHVKAAGDIQSSTNALEVASKNEFQFAKNQQLINSLMDQAPISFSKATSGLKMWTAATGTSSIRGDVARQTFEDVALSAASMGLSAETQEGVFLAMSQMMSKGTVQAEELRGQLGERLPGAFALMAKSMGVSERRLGKMMENGEVLSAEVLPKFAALLRTEFAGGLDKANNSINGTLVRLDNMQEKLIVGVTPAINATLVKFLELSNWMSSLEYEPVSDAFGHIMETLDPFLATLDRMFGKLESSGLIMKVLGSAVMGLVATFQIFIMTLNTVLLVLEGVVEVAQAIYEGEFSKIDEILITQAERIKDNYLDTFKSIKDGYTDIWTDENKSDSVTMKGGGSKLAGFLESAGAKTSPALSGTGKDGELKKANANISGSAPKITNISIGNLIGQNTNLIKRESEAQDLVTFSKMLLQSLQQEIVNVNLQV